MNTRAIESFAHTRTLFHLPAGLVYLDGHSLGPMPLAAQARVQRAVRDEWGELLIGGWNTAGWMDEPRRLGDRIGRLIGAADGSVVVGDTTSIRLFQVLAAALDIAPSRRIILSDSGNFPGDLYIAEGLLRRLGRGYELNVVAPEEVASAIDESVAVLMLTEVDYRTGRLHDMHILTRAAHAAGALAVWDLAHSAGAMPIDLAEAQADFAVGCTYKYLNGGPGAPAFAYVAPKHAEVVQPMLAGWLGHAAPFDFDLAYRAGAGIERMRVGTPPILGLSALDAALDVWEGVVLADVREASIALGELFIREVERCCAELKLASPRDPSQRGSHVSFRYREGYAVMQTLIARGVIGDFRAPDMMRFGIAPLYIGESEIRAAAAVLGEVMGERAWDSPRFRAKALVT